MMKMKMFFLFKKQKQKKERKKEKNAHICCSKSPKKISGLSSIVGNV